MPELQDFNLDVYTSLEKDFIFYEDSIFEFDINEL